MTFADAMIPRFGRFGYVLGKEAAIAKRTKETDFMKIVVEVNISRMLTEPWQSHREYTRDKLTLS